jgi:NAD(P)-dependent dehydrogenase (short-subunit alcohol dehydrogenase family)
MALKGKTAIVTGSGRGIGEGIAVVLAREGANVVVIDRNLDDAKKVVQQIMAAKGQAMPFAADVTKKDTLDAMVTATVKQFGTVDILVNNAGIESDPCYTKDLSEEDWDRIMAVNLKGPFLCCQAVIPTMIAQKSGRIINISSVAGHRMTFFGASNYTASKYGLQGFTHHLAYELAEHNITVNVVQPGFVMTPLMEQSSTPELRDYIIKRLIPLGRFCNIQDLGEMVAFLASDTAAMVTNQEVQVEGGITAGWGEDMRPILHKRIEEAAARRAKK